MVPSRPHAPPRAAFVSQIRSGGAPPSTATFDSASSFAKNASERLSGDQNIIRTPSVPASRRGTSESSRRTQSEYVPEESDATIASCVPSGEIATQAPSVMARPMGAAISKRFADGGTGCTSSFGPNHAAAVATRAVMANAAHGCAPVCPARAAGAAMLPELRIAIRSSISIRASPMSRRRRLESFSRHRRSSDRSRSGVLSGRIAQSGSVCRMCATMSDTVSPANA